MNREINSASRIEDFPEKSAMLLEIDRIVEICQTILNDGMGTPFSLAVFLGVPMKILDCNISGGQQSRLVFHDFLFC